MHEEQYYREIIEILKRKEISKERLAKLKVELCRKYNIKIIPTDIEILMHASPKDLEKLKLITKPTRTIAGVAAIAIMSYPFSCKHGKCIYCPGGPASVFGNVPQSYTGKEPATMRAIRNDFDAYMQTFNRLEQYVALGQEIDKIELIVMGGTFPSFDKSYQESFVKNSFKAMNDFSKMFFNAGKAGFSGLPINFAKYKEFFEMPGNIRDKEREKRILKKVLELKNKNKKSLQQEQKRNETAKARCVALCLETRPDFCNEKEINEMLKLGTTRAELGVQTLQDKILNKVKRGHKIKDTIKATQLLRDSFLKVGYHMMPGLPLSNKENDISMFKELFSNPDFKPDALKIYPCMVIQGTELFKLWKNKKYSPLTTMQAAEIIAEAKRFIPKYCRIMRVQRDISSNVVSAGVDRTNLRQYVDSIIRKKGIKCNCIRCREPKTRTINFNNVKILSSYYEASNGREVFISAEDLKNDILVGFCRLRIPYQPFRKEITQKSAGIRELHVYGAAAPLGEEGSIQHRGIGKELMKEAERIAREEFGKNKMVVISGVGAKEYYAKLGYKKEGPYMVKRLTKNF